MYSPGILILSKHFVIRASGPVLVFLERDFLLFAIVQQLLFCVEQVVLHDFQPISCIKVGSEKMLCNNNFSSFSVFSDNARIFFSLVYLRCPFCIIEGVYNRACHSLGFRSFSGYIGRAVFHMLDSFIKSGCRVCFTFCNLCFCSIGNEFEIGLVQRVR